MHEAKTDRHGGRAAERTPRRPAAVFGSASQHEEAGGLGLAGRPQDRGGLQRVPRGMVGRQGAGHQPDGQSAAGRRARYHGDLLGLLRISHRHLSPARCLRAPPRAGEHDGQCGDRGARTGGGRGDRCGGARGALALLCDGCHSGVAFRRGGARQHRALHGAARKGVGQQSSRLALSARHLAQRDGAAPRRSGIHLVRRRVRRRPALCEAASATARSSRSRSAPTSTTCRS